MKLNIFKTKEELGEELAKFMANTINSTLKNQEYFTLALSGGETPKILFKILASPVYKEKINWKRVHIFWGDERVVPFTDERNNAKMAYDLLIDKIDIPSSQIHIMRTDIEPVFAVAEYERILHYYFTNTSNSFDLVLLGMGEDGHTLSLFPGTSLVEKDNVNWVNEVYNKNQGMFRITLMPSLVNRASKIVFMVDGSKKSEVLKKVIQGKYNPLELPAQIIQPVHGELYWFLDEEAAKSLNTSQEV